MEIEVWSDGSGNTFESDGGYGYRILLNGRVLEEGSGYLESATNNVAELRGAIAGLSRILSLVHTKEGIFAENNEEIRVTLVSDSQLVLGYASGRYKCKALHLTELYVELRRLYKELNCECRWVKGHSKVEHNERCDKLAKAARESKGQS